MCKYGRLEMTNKTDIISNFFFSGLGIDFFYDQNITIKRQ